MHVSRVEDKASVQKGFIFKQQCTSYQKLPFQTTTLLLCTFLIGSCYFFFPAMFLKVGLTLMGVVCLFACKKFKRLFKFFIWWAVIEGFELLIICHIVTNDMLITVLMPFIFMIAGFGLFMMTSLLVFDTDTAHLMAALEAFHIPRPLTVGLTIVFKYLPTFGREFRLIKESLRIRGFEFSIKKPIQSFEYFLVPQLFRCIILGDEITKAGLMRGISAKGRRTSYLQMTYGVADGLLLAATLLFIVGGFYARFC